MYLRDISVHSFRQIVCAAALAAVGLPAIAQQKVEAAQAEPQLEEVVVTGSRIAAPNLTSTSPIQVVTAKEIQAGGKTDIIDVINQLPQFFQNTGSDFSNTSSGLTTPGGVTTADLRGLGPQRTLVLVNGRRLGIGDPNTTNPNPAPDLDQIPTALIERVDVVTGGASAVYGSDAVAGVVNFIMKRDFQGVELDGQFSGYMHNNHEGWINALEQTTNTIGYAPVTGHTNDGHSRNFSVLMGTNFAEGAGNVTGYLVYQQADPISSGQRDFGACQLNLNAALNGLVCHGSANSNYFSTADGSAYSVVGNQLLPWPQNGSNPGATFNSQKYIYMSRGDDRYLGGFMAHDDVNQYFKPYAEFSFMTDKTNITIAPSGLFQSNPIDPTGNGNFNVNCSNPLLSAQEQSIVCSPAQIAAGNAAPSAPCQFVTDPVTKAITSPNCGNINIGRRNVEGGGREAFFNHTNYRAVFGSKGDFLDAWNYDAYGQYYYTTLYNLNSNYLNFSKVNNALQVTGTAANPVCISGGACVPWNIWKTGGVTPDQTAALYDPGTGYGSVTEKILHADVTGELGKYGIKSPLASEGVGVNVGFEHRREDLSFAPDAATNSGLLSGIGSYAAVSNGYSLKEGFIEARFPLVQNITGVKDLVMDGGYRHSDYSTAGGVNTFKFEVQYAPIDDVRFRYTYQRAIRAANVIELFTPQNFGQISAPGVDPCAPTRDPSTGALIPATSSLADCVKTGVTAAEYGNGGTTNTIKQCVANQCAQIQGGNPQLKPEQSDSISVGMNFTPTFLPNFNASLDFFRIKLKDEVGVISAPIILQNCLATGDPTYCSLIVRTSQGGLSGSSVATGGYIVQTNLNVGAVRVEGVDLQTNYKLPLGDRFGSLMFSLSGSYLIEFSTQTLPGAAFYDCSGLYGQTCLTVNPKWRHNLRTSWQTPWDIEITALWRYIGRVSLDTNSQDPLLNNGVNDLYDAHISAQNYIDLSAAWNVVKGLQLRAGVNNLFDRDPPINASSVVSSGAANSYPTYDQLGRQLFVAFTAKF